MALSFFIQQPEIVGVGPSDLVAKDLFFQARIGYSGNRVGNLSVSITLTNAEGTSVTHTELTERTQVAVSIPLPIDMRITSDANASMAVYADIRVTVAPEGLSLTGSVAQLCERTASTRFCITNFVKSSNSYVGCLKAFCSFNDPAVRDKVPYAMWEYSYDGIHFQPAPHRTYALNDGVWVKTLPTVLNTSTSVDRTDAEEGAEEAAEYVAKQFFPLTGVSEQDLLYNRYDALPVPVLGASKLDAITYTFKVVFVKQLPERATFKDINGVDRQCEYEEDFMIGFSQYYTMLSENDEFVEYDLGNASFGNALYHNATLYTYGDPKFANNIMASNPGEFTRPLSNIIDLAAQEDTLVTNITPWRDYLIAFTEGAVYLITKASGGYLTKTINTSIGIPKQDWRCCKAVLNGVIFKSESKVYLLYPNMYSGDETVLNITDLSKPIEDYVVEYTADDSTFPFALSTEEAYFLFMPNSKSYTTSCLKYNYNDKLWATYEYPALFTDFEMFSVNDIRIFAKVKTDAGITYAEFTIEKDVEDLFETIANNLPYGDFLTESTLGIAADIANWTDVSETQPSPVHFVMDSGQKTDSLGYTKQFVETKFVVATEHERDTFPMEVTVHVDGDPRVHIMDINTDSPFWKSAVSHVGTLGAGPVLSADAAPLNTFRQMFLRYSGKGKSVRHIVEGTSVYKFKLYGMYIRYRNLNVKQ